MRRSISILGTRRRRSAQISIRSPESCKQAQRHDWTMRRTTASGRRCHSMLPVRAQTPPYPYQARSKPTPEQPQRRSRNWNRRARLRDRSRCEGRGRVSASQPDPSQTDPDWFCQSRVHRPQEGVEQRRRLRPPCRQNPDRPPSSASRPHRYCPLWRRGCPIAASLRKALDLKSQLPLGRHLDRGL